jgi:hypothetical protein
MCAECGISRQPPNTIQLFWSAIKKIPQSLGLVYIPQNKLRISVTVTSRLSSTESFAQGPDKGGAESPCQRQSALLPDNSLNLWTRAEQRKSSVVLLPRSNDGAVKALDQVG